MAAADLIILEEVLDKLHLLIENGKLVGPYKKQLQKFQWNLTIALCLLKEIANSEKRVDAFKEIKKELMYIVLVAEHQLLDDYQYQHCPQSSTSGPSSSPGETTVHVGCMNGGALWVSVHQHLMARRLCKLNQQFRKIKNQLVDIREDILKEQLSDSRHEMSGFLQEIALTIIVCYAVAYALSNLLIDQSSLALSMQQRNHMQQQIRQIIAKIDQLSRIQQRIVRLMITMQQRRPLYG